MKRKTSITKIASILTVLAMVWGGVACQPEAPVEPTKYTISFDSGVESITVEEGTVAKEPTTAPEKTGYTFGGWLNGEAAYDWTQPVTSNLSLTAKWTAVEYTITYLPEGVETDNPTTYTIETETIVLADPKNAPDATKTKFVAWHVDSEEGAVVTEIAKGSTGNKTFYAEFSAEEPCVVKFMLGTEEVKSINVKKDTKITLPTDLEKYSLFSDEDCTKAFDTNTAITEDTTIYVKLKTFTISYKVLPFDNVNPVEGETNGSMPVEYGTVFTNEEINAFAEEIPGYTYKGIFTDEACKVLFDNTNAITSDLTVYVLYEEVVEEDSTEAALATTFKFGETYSGKVTYPMVENSGYDNATASDVMFNIDLSDQTLKTKDVVKVSFKITECSSDAINSFGYQSQIDNWGWHSINVKELGSTYNLSFEVGETTEFEGNLVGIKLVPQDSDGSLIGKDLVIKIEDLSVSLVPYVEGAKQTKVLYEGEGFAPYTDTFLASDLQTVLDSSTGDASLIITYKLGDYTPEYDYDGVAIFAGWDESWTDSKDDFTAYSINTGCSAADYVVGTEKEKSFAVSDILTDLSKTFRFTINIYNNKIVITNIKVEYTEK